MGVLKEPIIGGNHIQDEEIEAQVERLKSDRAIVVLPLNDGADVEPELKHCETIAEVFKTYQPSAEVSVEDEEGSAESVQVRFNRLPDFDLESVTQAVPAMKAQHEKLSMMLDLRNQLKENVKLKKAVDDPDQRKKLVASLQQALRALQGEG